MNDIVGVAPHSRSHSLAVEAGCIIEQYGTFTQSSTTAGTAKDSRQPRHCVQYNIAIRLFKYRIRALLTLLSHLFIITI